MIPLMRTREITHFHLFGGIGGGALGFNAGSARVGHVRASFRCLGSVDVDAGACADFTRLVGVKATCRDLFDRQQYIDFHGHAPPSNWREADHHDLREASQWTRPDIVFTSPPCKGFSGLLNPRSAATKKYQALNRLTVRSIGLVLRAWADDPVPLIILENVPRIAQRGRALLDEIVGLLEAAGYAVAETVHNCGEIGGLAQNRTRFLLVARHREKVPPFLYEPDTSPVRAIGDVLSGLPMPSDAIPMHRLPRLQWRTWVRLALIPPGKDWRALADLEVVDGHLRDLALVPARPYFRGSLGVKAWGDIAATVTGESLPFNGAHSVADPRASTDWGGKGKYGVTPFTDPAGTVIAGSTTGNGAFAVADPRAPRDLGGYQPYGVVPWGHPSHTVTSQAAPGAGSYSVQDPRFPEGRFNNVYRVVSWAEASPAVTGGTGPSAGGLAVSDPRLGSYGQHYGKMRVEDWEGTAHTVTGSDRVGSGAMSIADPRPGWGRSPRGDWSSGGHYGVLDWKETSGAVVGHAKHDRGKFSVAEPRLPAPTEQCTPLILSLDDTWHRPLTTLELAALQSFPVDGLLLEGASDAAWRERIGNAVPPAAATAIASTMAETLLLAEAGETFTLSARPIWVQPVALALTLPTP